MDLIEGGLKQAFSTAAVPVRKRGVDVQKNDHDSSDRVSSRMFVSAHAVRCNRVRTNSRCPRTSADAHLPDAVAKTMSVVASAA